MSSLSLHLFEMFLIWTDFGNFLSILVSILVSSHFGNSSLRQTSAFDPTMVNFVGPRAEARISDAAETRSSPGLSLGQTFRKKFSVKEDWLKPGRKKQKE
jgi:hypothetical protein